MVPNRTLMRGKAMAKRSRSVPGRCSLNHPGHRTPALQHAPPLDWQLLSTGSYWRSPPCPVEVGSVPPRLLAFQHSCSAPTLLVRSAARTYPCSLIDGIFSIRRYSSSGSPPPSPATRAALARARRPVWPRTHRQNRCNPQLAGTLGTARLVAPVIENDGNF